MKAIEEYNIAHKNYGMFLGQKAKVRWIQEGDDNTKLFHRSIKARRLHNRINTIKKGDGSWAHNSKEVTEAFLGFYQELLGNDGRVRNVEYVIIEKGCTLNDNQQARLTLDFSADEIKHALFSIPDDKSPGIDGYSSCFFKKSWNIVGLDIVAAIQDFFRSGKLLKEINVTAITLIPKV